jgi:hypothetical protein
MPITVNHSTPADGTFSATGATAWNADHTLAGVGTLAEQNANAVAITGGTINNTSIGATVPSTVNATTITGQTGQLNGTGTNLVLQSQTFDNASWSKSRGTITANTAVAPDGTITADSFNQNSGQTNAAVCFQSISLTIGAFSVFAKANTKSKISLFTNTAAGNETWFDLSNGTVGTTGASHTATITNFGNGWYRCLVVTSSAITAQSIYLADTDNSRTVTDSGGVFLWGAQFELGSTANTYIPTTTTAVYGTPTLSFSGVSTIGLESNGALYLQPAGTGALQAQATTSTTAGGNARGANAVDFQTVRNSAGQVASGTYSVIGGGQNNTASGFLSFAGGQNSTASNNYAFVGNGTGNTASGYISSIVAGYTNTAAGFFNFIGNGYANSGTSGSAVTTQSGTMNGTTAVTLSGSNANIKVGQIITGTSINIFPNTYVAAISGTSLTLSQNASGSSTSTLSFFTPHGVVVGGGNNQATGSYSFIGGGGNAGTAAQRNVASGDWSFVGGGSQNTASGGNSSVLGGGNCSASSSFAVCLGGAGNSASGFGSTNLGGNGNVANGTYSVASGFSSTNRSLSSFAYASGSASVGGDAQTEIFVLRNTTTDATATALTLGASAPSTTNQVILPNNSAYFFRGEVISGVTGGGNTKGWTIEGVIKRGANAAATTLVGTPTVTSSFADAGASAWAIAVTADTTNGGLRVTFTGQAATTIRTVCQIRTTEMTY